MIGLKGFYKALEKAWEVKLSLNSLSIAQPPASTLMPEKKSRDSANLQSGGSIN
jgi:hypothetical protein